MKRTIAKLLLAFSIAVISVTGIAHADNTIPVTPAANTYTDPCAAAGKNCYTIFSGFATALGGKFNQIADASSLGALINGILAFAIGVGGVLAVVMIMYEGFLYMQSDNVNTKGRARSNIVKTVIGFLLLLSIYTILRTINPQLLNLTPGIDISGLSPEQGDSTEPTFTTPDTTPPPANSGDTICPGGMKGVSGGIYVCTTIAASMQQMLDAAKAAGITLSSGVGGSYRDPSIQIALRKQNCGTSNYNIYQEPSTSCTPWTAIPGTSRHESGLAVDFMCNSAGVIDITKRPATAICFNWLKANAATYGFYNLPAENWHWSIDGQ